MLLDFIHHYLFLVLFLTGFLAATVDAIAGGGGLISLPVLLGIGLPPHLALGTNKLQSSCGTLVAAFSYYRRGFLEKGNLLFGCVFTLLGAVLGAVTIQFLSSDTLRKFIPIFLFFILMYMLFSPKIGDQDQTPKMSEKYFFAIFGTILGFYDGFLGPGVGSFWVFLIVYFLGKNLVKATAYTKAFNANTNVAALICFALGSNIDYKIGGCMIAGQLIGGRLGAHLAMQKGAKLIRPLFIGVICTTILTLAYKSYASTDILANIFQQFDLATLVACISSGLAVLLMFVFRRMKKQNIIKTSE